MLQRPADRSWPHSLAHCWSIVLACAEGLDHTKVAAQEGVHSAAVSKWRKRFIEQRPGSRFSSVGIATSAVLKMSRTQNTVKGLHVYDAGCDRRMAKALGELAATPAILSALRAVDRRTFFGSGSGNLLGSSALPDLGIPSPQPDPWGRLTNPWTEWRGTGGATDLLRSENGQNTFEAWNPTAP
jgi:transposase-like protein